MIDRSFEEAFFWALYYNGFHMHADAMYEYLKDPKNRDRNVVYFPHGESACVTKDDVTHDRPNSYLWMCLVQMFGDYGTSPRYGWITQPDEACAWLREMRRATYRGEQVFLDDGSLTWRETDEDIRDSVSEWERRMSGDCEQRG